MISNADNHNKICSFIFKYINIYEWGLKGVDVDMSHIREQNFVQSTRHV
jgi:hypothetical protein